MDIPSHLNMETTNSYLTVKSYILQNILRPGGEGLAQLEVWKEGGKSGYVNQTIRVNEPPQAGYCVCIPQMGEGYKTEFQVNCSGWVDPDTPIMYGFSYGDGVDSNQVLTSKENPSLSRTFKIYKLPAEGIPSLQIRITVSVEDSLGLKSEMVLYVEVREMNEYSHRVIEIKSVIRAITIFRNDYLDVPLQQVLSLKLIACPLKGFDTNYIWSSPLVLHHKPIQLSYSYTLLRSIYLF